VDNDIRNDWLAAMSSADASVAASYDTAIHALAATRDVSFDIPGDLGPSWTPAFDERSGVAAAPAVALPAGPMPTAPAAAPGPPPPMPEAPQELPATGDAASANPLGDAAGLSSGAGGLGGLGGTTGGIGGVVGSIVDSIGSLLGSLAGGLGGGPDAGDDPLDLDDADDPLVDDDADDADADKPDGEVPPSTDNVVPAAPVIEYPPTAAEVVGEPAAQQVDAPTDMPPPAEQVPPAAAPPEDGSTPCEIAEDQLPQVGQ
jgi:hypothetical protein